MKINLQRWWQNGDFKDITENDLNIKKLGDLGKKWWILTHDLQIFPSL